ncbi:MAG: hypothetical protein ACRC9R_04745 [Enterovibrio sp.]
MKYIGYVLFLALILGFLLFGPAQTFYKESLDLAPEITILVSVSYGYVILLTILLSLFPNLSGNRPVTYENHIKMACSVMVSLGLVGTFIGLVDMISGIGKALSGDDTDFAAQMAALLKAISDSLGAMAFAFMTSILGVGVSAYTSVAATFVSTSFQERRKIEINIKEEQQVVENQRRFAAEVAKYVDNNILDRIESLENKIISVRLDSVGNEISPLIMSEIIMKHHQMLDEYNNKLLVNVKDLNSSLDSVSLSLKKISDDFSNHYIALNDLNKSVKQNNVALIQIQHLSETLEHKIIGFSDRIRGVFKDV